MGPRPRGWELVLVSRNREQDNLVQVRRKAPFELPEPQSLFGTTTAFGRLVVPVGQPPVSSLMA